MTLLEIVCREGVEHNEKIRELQQFLGKNHEIPVDKELFRSALFTKNAVNMRKEIMYLILHHCIKFNSGRSEKEDTVSPVNKKIIKIVSLPKLYCEVKKYFQFTSYIAA